MPTPIFTPLASPAEARVIASLVFGKALPLWNGSSGWQLHTNSTPATNIDMDNMFFIVGLFTVNCNPGSGNWPCSHRSSGLSETGEWDVTCENPVHLP